MSDKIDFKELHKYKKVRKDGAIAAPREELSVTKDFTGVVVSVNGTDHYIDPEEVYRLASLHCTDVDIGRWFGVSPALIKRHCGEELVRGREETKQKLRKAQLESALSGNATMLKWLGVQMLQQKESKDITVIHGEQQGGALNERITALVNELDPNNIIDGEVTEVEPD